MIRTNHISTEWLKIEQKASGKDENDMATLTIFLCFHNYCFETQKHSI